MSSDLFELDFPVAPQREREVESSRALGTKISKDFTITEKAPTRYTSTDRGVNISFTLNSVLNVKSQEGTFNQEKALVVSFSVIVKSLRTFV